MYIKSNILFKDTRPERIYDDISRPVIIADNLLTPENMGSMIRLADNIGAEKMIFLGQETAKSVSHIRRCAASSRDNIEWFFTEEDDLRKLVGTKKSSPLRLPTMRLAFTTRHCLLMSPLSLEMKAAASGRRYFRSAI